MAVPAEKHVPSPADKKPEEPKLSARQILGRIRQREGHIHRMREVSVFVITDSPELAEWLLSIGGVPFLPRGMTPEYTTPRGSYTDAKGGRPKWDIYIHHIKVRGEQTIWEAAVRGADVEYYNVGQQQ